MHWQGKTKSPQFDADSDCMDFEGVDMQRLFSDEMRVGGIKKKTLIKPASSMEELLFMSEHAQFV